MGRPRAGEQAFTLARTRSGSASFPSLFHEDHHGVKHLVPPLLGLRLYAYGANDAKGAAKSPEIQEANGGAVPSHSFSRRRMSSDRADEAALEKRDSFRASKRTPSPFRGSGILGERVSSPLLASDDDYFSGAIPHVEESAVEDEDEDEEDPSLGENYANGNDDEASEEDVWPPIPSPSIPGHTKLPPLPSCLKSRPSSPRASPTPSLRSQRSHCSSVQFCDDPPQAAATYSVEEYERRGEEPVKELSVKDMTELSNLRSAVGVWSGKLDKWQEDPLSTPKVQEPSPAKLRTGKAELSLSSPDPPPLSSFTRLRGVVTLARNSPASAPLSAS